MQGVLRNFLALLLLYAFSQVYSMNYEQKVEYKVSKNLEFFQKGECEVGTMGSIVAEEIRAIKEQPSALPWISRKTLETYYVTGNGLKLVREGFSSRREL